MPDTIPNLWPKEIKINIQSPYAILSVQAGLLSKVTRGILEGTVETEAAKEKVQHRLVVVAPAFNSYRHTLIAALHDPNLPYPAEVRAEALAEQAGRVDESGELYYVAVYPKAYDDDEMVRLVSEALNSAPTRAAILSLIAKSNDAKLASTPPGENGNGTDGTGA